MENLPEKAKEQLVGDLAPHEEIKERIDLSKRYDLFKIAPQNIRLIKEDDDPISLLFKICELSHDEKYPRREAMENVISAMALNNNSTFNFVYFLDGNEDNVGVYVGIANTGSDTDLNVSDFLEVLQSSFSGNFAGSVLEDVENNGIEKLRKKIENSKFGLIVGVPSLSKHDKSQLSTDFQGIDRLINAMRGVKSWQVVLVCEAVSYEEICEFKKQFHQEYDRLAPYQYVDKGVGSNYAENEATTHAEGKVKSKSISEQHSNDRDSKGTSTGTQESVNDSFQKGKNRGVSQNETRKFENKEVSEIIDYFKKVLSERINVALTKGLFKTALYTFASDKMELVKLQNNIISIFQGDESSFCSLHPVIIDDADDELKKRVASFRIMKSGNNCKDLLLPVINSTPCISETLSFATYMTPKEISIVAGIPTKEVNGISLRESVEFGVNIPLQQDDDKIELGFILDRGSELKQNKVWLTKSDLNKHIFVAGVTGAGKTVTCQKILLESECPWCVIEPAKTEYRCLINRKNEKIRVFTLGNENCSPFRLNPFELMRGETVSAHADMLKAAFTASFSMEAAMPQLVEEAVYDAYDKKKWDLEDTFGGENENREFPNMGDFLNSLESVCRNKNFGDRLQGEYLGSLVARFKSLTLGNKGAMLNCRKSIFNFEELIEQKIVFELEELKDPADKAFLMSLILMKLAHAVKLKYKNNKNFRHITLIEEAHRVLSKPEPGVADSKKYGVQVFADMIAEVRKYGESFIITDQIPAQLTPEVIKNTNTKIIHKIFAKDDKEIVGNTMALNDKQKDYLSKMKVGEAVMFSQGWDKAVNVKITMAAEHLAEPDDDEIREKCADKYLCDKKKLQKYVVRNFKYSDKEKITKFKLDFLKKDEFIERFLGEVTLSEKDLVNLKEFLSEIFKGEGTCREVRDKYGSFIILISEGGI